MEILDFDKKIQELVTSMVEASFEFVDNNKEEVDRIYIYASTENLNPFFNVFYKINEKLIEMHRVNEASKQQYEVSDDRMFDLLDEGVDLLDEVIKLFQEDDREVPTLMKITFDPKTNAFNNDISYEPQYSNNPERSNTDNFEEWFEEMKNGN